MIVGCDNKSQIKHHLLKYAELLTPLLDLSCDHPPKSRAE